MVAVLLGHGASSASGEVLVEASCPSLNVTIAIVERLSSSSCSAELLVDMSDLYHAPPRDDRTALAVKGHHHWLPLPVGLL